MTGRRVLVCGGRDYADREHVFACLDRLHSAGAIDRIIHGGASGADTLAATWAALRGIDEVPYPAAWRFPDGTIDRSAGPRRNAHMLLKGRPDLVFAFPGGAGTNDMVAKARAAGVVVMRAPLRAVVAPPSPGS